MLEKYIAAGNNGAKRQKVQQEMKDAVQVANDQEKLLFSWLRLIAIHNIPPAKLRDEDFITHIIAEKVAYQTFIHILIKVTYIVEEKIAVEM